MAHLLIMERNFAVQALLFYKYRLISVLNGRTKLNNKNDFAAGCVGMAANQIHTGWRTRQQKSITVFCPC